MSCSAQLDGRFSRRAAVLLMVIFAVLSGSGCAFLRANYGDDFDAAQLEAIKVGTSTRQDVAALLGAPERIVEVNDQEIFHYYNYALKSGSVLFFSRTNIKGNDLYVFFSPEGIAQHIVFGRPKAPPKFQFWPFGD